MITWDYRSFFCLRACITIIPQLMALKCDISFRWHSNVISRLDGTVHLNSNLKN